MEYQPKGSKYEMEDLLEIMRILRSENGCPWDRVQTHESIRMNFVEEVYEALEAIDQKDSALLREELGDVLLQVVFHTQMEAEVGSFDLSDVIHDLCCKLIVRHPHIFGNSDAETIPEVLNAWNEIKRQTKGQTTYTQTLQSAAKTLPALMRAQKVQSRSIKAGLQADTPLQLLTQLQRELDHLSYCTDEQQRKDSLGRLLFDAAQLSQAYQYQAEELLERQTDAYIDSFSAMEEAATLAGKQIKDCEPTSVQDLMKDD